MKQLKIEEAWEKSNLQQKKCPICKQKARYMPTNYDGYIYACIRCGKFFISRSLEVNLSREEPNYILSSYLREKYEFSDIEYNELNTYSYEELNKIAIESVPEFSEKLYKTLFAVQKIQSYFGEFIPALDRNILVQKYLESLSYSITKEEYIYILKALLDLGYLRYEKVAILNFLTISPQGYKYLEEYKKRDIKNLKNAFIAIKFDEEYESIANAIKEAIIETRYKPVKVDEEHHTKYIMDFIISKIKESRFLVAELTSQNLGVYYEMGYAIGRNIPVIAVLKKEPDGQHFDKVHFDLKQYNIIEYNDEKDLKEKLINRIRALFG